MRPIFFVADLHLQNQHTPVAGLFVQFLELVAEKGGDLYILGDLFDYWINSRFVRDRYRLVIEKLKEPVQAGGEVGFIYGNRDFLLQKKYLAEFGVKFYGESCSLHLGEQFFYLTHGDNLVEDTHYQLYRRWVWRAWRLLDVIMPGWIKDGGAKKLRQQSRKIAAGKSAREFRLYEDKIQALFERGVDTIICGHFHKPGLKHYRGKHRLLILPAWGGHDQGYGLWEAGELKLLPFP